MIHRHFTAHLTQVQLDFSFLCGKVFQFWGAVHYFKIFHRANKRYVSSNEPNICYFRAILSIFRKVELRSFKCTKLYIIIIHVHMYVLTLQKFTYPS